MRQLFAFLLLLVGLGAFAWQSVTAQEPESDAQVLAEGEEASAESQEEEGNPYRPGLVARFTSPDGAEYARLEEHVSHVWRDAPPDRRLPAGAFSVQFRGRLQVQAPGSYRLHVYLAGSVKLKLVGQELIKATSKEPAWFSSEPIELPFDFHPLEVEYTHQLGPAQVAIFWEGPQFGLEPLAGRWLFHEVNEAPADDFQRGEQLVAALRCAACHTLPGETPALVAPALDHVAGNLSPAWLADWLTHSSKAEKSGPAASATRRMPHFAFTPEQATAIAESLLKHSEALAAPSIVATRPSEPEGDKKKKSKTPLPPVPVASVERGATLFRSLGCLACHQTGELGTDGLFGGGDLSHVAAKRPADFFARWLVDPASVNRNHRMPVFALDALQVDSLALYLKSLGPSPTSSTKSQEASVKVEQGVTHVRAAQCSACHALPAALTASTKPLPLTDKSLERDDDSCLAEPNAQGTRPGYRLNEADRQAVRTFISETSRVKGSPLAERNGERLLTENNCLACHARGFSAGLTARLPALAEADPSLRELLPALTPPALFGVGDKLQEDSLTQAISNPQPRHTWLHVRMPRFRLSAAEIARLSEHFIDNDRVPTHPKIAESSTATIASEPALDSAGPRLVTADGFGCTSCHAIGKWIPQKVALNAQGAQLSEIGSRVRREWFDRWVHNPARIVPQMEMPSVQQPVRGVLDGNLAAQLDAVWRVLNRPDFTPPSPNALRVVRRSNLADQPEPAAVLTENIEAASQRYIKPLIIGLDNRQNVLIDLGTNRLAAWWIGDTARQQTRGKSWYWEAGVPQLLPKANDKTSDVTLRLGKRSLEPTLVGEYLTEFDKLVHAKRGVEFSTRLQFEIDNRPQTVTLIQRFSPLPASPGQWSGFTRQVRVRSNIQPEAWELLALPGDCMLSSDGRVASLAGPHGALRVALSNELPARFTRSPRGALLSLPTVPAGEASVELEYRSEATPDQFLPLPAIDRSLTRETLAVVPGFDAERLPVTDQAMPTGLAWRADGALFVTSLEGRVWRGRDTDGDGLEDKLEPWSDDLAAPFGVATNGDEVDVINKFGLLRLRDADNNGHAERIELLASGWGHTRDYHDWAVGLPRDKAGNYYVSLACQQDQRSEAGAALRGQVVQLVPREPTADNPRRFGIESLAAGLRFPQGIALSSAEELFVTDNQGNYTPFNELNHVVRGKRYGFINRLESEKGLNPPFQSAAVEIPHPWTRSVNGICFLEAPAAVTDKLGKALFGPFTGHLVGCEYDTRRLVRMSLQHVGSGAETTIQGAAYPLSSEPAPGQPTFEGPLVCQVSPRGDLYIGSIRDSGWGAGANTGSLVRLRYNGQLPPGIAEVQATSTGFSIDFTTPIDRQRAVQTNRYAISSYRRTPTPAYGGADQDRRIEKIQAITLSEDARRVTLSIDGLREGFVYEFHVRDLTDNKNFFPSEAYYTLRRRVP